MKKLAIALLLLCASMAWGQDKWTVKASQNDQAMFVRAGTAYTATCMDTTVVGAQPFSGGEVQSETIYGVTVYTTTFKEDCSGVLSLVGKQFPDCRADNWKAFTNGKECVGLGFGESEGTIYFHVKDRRKNIIVSIKFSL